MNLTDGLNKMIEKIDYWITIDTIIFKPDFNKSLDEYIEILQNCKKKNNIL